MIVDFPSFAMNHGLLGPFVADGEIHRTATEGKPRRKNGAYRWRDTWGWVLDYQQHEKAVIWFAKGEATEAVRIDMQAIAERERAKSARAAEIAARIVNGSRASTHDYLVRKGFRESMGLVDPLGEHVPTAMPSRPPYLVVPMRSHRTSAVQSVQWIDPDGVKLFLAGASTRGAVHVLGRGPETWFCEGYATGLSLLEGLKRLYRQSRVVVCFSAANLKHVAMLTEGRRYVMADRDATQKNGRPGAGQTAAAESGVPWVAPAMDGDDANDVHQRDGIGALVDLMREAYQ